MILDALTNPVVSAGIALVNMLALFAHAALVRHVMKARRHRDLTCAECVECSYMSAPVPVSLAVEAAKEHRAETGHAVMVRTD